MTGRLVRGVRRFIGRTLDDVARETGITTQRLSRAERGMVNLDAGELAAIRNYLQECLSAESAVLDENFEIRKAPAALPASLLVN